VYRVTADSNIYISALLFGGKPLTLLEMAHEGQIELAASDDLLTEALGVLRDKFQRTPEQLSQDEASIVAVTRHVVPAERLDVVPLTRTTTGCSNALPPPALRPSSRVMATCSDLGAFAE
jgi:predicted nucleic acid-binding protein